MDWLIRRLGGVTRSEMKEFRDVLYLKCEEYDFQISGIKGIIKDQHELLKGQFEDNKRLRIALGGEDNG